MSIAAIILCGGRSTRMGRDKASLPIHGETMLSRVARLVSAVADDVIVVGRRDQQFPHGVTVVNDPAEDLGPLAGLAAGLIASRSDLNIVVACDMPLINPTVLERLTTMIGDDDMCVAVIDGHPSVLCGVYRSTVGSVAQSLLDSGERRVMRLLDLVTVRMVDSSQLTDLDPDLKTFVSVDTPEAYAAALKGTA